MDKKKALKIATATSVAAGAFVSAAPASFAASSQYKKADAAVKTAEKEAAKLKEKYYPKSKKFSFTKISTTATESAYSKAYKEVKKLSSKDEKKFEKRLAGIKSNITYAKGYNTAIDKGSALDKATKAANDLVKKYDAKKADATLKSLKSAIDAFKGAVAKGKVYGIPTRDAFNKKYLTPADSAYKALDKKIKDEKAKAEYAKKYAAAKSAVEKLEKATADLSTHKKVEEAQALVKPARTAVKELNKTDAAAFTKRIDAAESLIKVAQADYDTKVAHANEAVKALEEAAADLSTKEKIDAADALIGNAKNAVKLLDEDDAADLTKRIGVAEEKVKAAKEAYATKLANAQKAVKALEDATADLTSKDKVKAAKDLVEPAKNSLKDLSEKDAADLTAKIDAAVEKIKTAEVTLLVNDAVKAVNELEAATKELKTQEAVDAAKAKVQPAKDAIKALPEGNENIATLTEKVTKAEEAIQKAEAWLALPVVDSASSINTNTVELKVGSLLTEKDLLMKKVSLKSEDKTVTATYVAGSLAEGKAKFQLDNFASLTDAATYTVSADWARFTNADFVAKVAAQYAKTFEKQTSEVVAQKGLTKVYIAAKNQYGEPITLDSANAKEVTVKATLNGMPLTVGADKEVSYTAGDDYVTVNHDLAVNDQLVITLVSNKVESVLSYTVVKAPESGLVASSLQLSAEKTSIASGNSTNVKVTVKDQYNNPVAVGKGDIRWFVDGVEDTKQTGATFKFDKTASKQYKVQAFYAKNTKLSQSVTINVGAAELKSLTVSPVGGATVYNKEAVNAFTVTQNEGALLTPSDLKYVVTAKPEGAKDSDVAVTFAYGSTDNPDTPNVDETKVIYANVKSEVAGTYKFKVYTGSAVDAKDGIVSVEQSFTSSVRQDVTDINVEEFGTNELTAEKQVVKPIKFTNKHGEEVNVTADQLQLASTSNMTVKLLNKDKEVITTDSTDKVVKYISFTGAREGKDTVTLVKGSVSKQITTTTLAKSAVSRIDASDLTGNNAIISGDSDVKYIDLNVTDQYNVKLLDKDLLKVEVKAPGDDAFATSDLATLVYLDKDNEVTTDQTKAVKVAVKVDPSKATVKAGLKSEDYTVKVSDKATGKVSKEVTVTAKEARKLDSITATVTNAQFALGSNGQIKFETKDQYGQLIELKDADLNNVTVKSDESGSGVLEGITKDESKAQLVKVTKNGKFAGYSYNVTAASKGNATITFTIGGKSVPVNVKVDSVGSLVDSVKLSTADAQKPLYSSKGEVTLKATAFTASGSEVPVSNADLNWSVDSINGTVLENGKEVAASKDSVTVNDGKVDVPDSFKGKVTVKVTTANLKSATLELNFDNAQAAPVKGSTKVTETVAKALDADTATAGIQVALDGKGEVDHEANGAVSFTLDAIDQYGEIFDVRESDAIVTTDDSSVLTLNKAADKVTVTAKGEGKANVYVQYNGDTIVLNFTVNKDALTSAKDFDAASSVTKLIEALPAVNQLKLSDEQAVNDANAAFNKLTDSQKQLVSKENQNKLKAAMQKIDDLKAQATVNAEAAKINSVQAPTQGDTKLTMPEVAEGFTVVIKSSSDENIIAKDGTIKAPDENTDVTLVFTVTDSKTGKSADSTPIKVTVPVNS
ncbi:hypothetical protein WD019_09485 [Fictibacillus sp. Mic-4]|uniref:hypothetical protein n=1 Tax=Fictibacillus sp. Mic-4 TaxID=3132826 RepID=UPI003CF89CF8